MWATEGRGPKVTVGELGLYLGSQAERAEKEEGLGTVTEMFPRRLEYSNSQVHKVGDPEESSRGENSMGKGSSASSQCTRHTACIFAAAMLATWRQPPRAEPGSAPSELPEVLSEQVCSLAPEAAAEPRSRADATVPSQLFRDTR